MAKNNVNYVDEVLWEDKKVIFARLGGEWTKVIVRTIERGRRNWTGNRPVITAKYTFVRDEEKLGSLSVTDGVCYSITGDGEKLFRSFQLLAK